VALVAAVSGVVALLEPHAPVSGLLVLYLFAVLPVAIAWGAGYAAGVSILSTAAFDFLFVGSRFSFTLGHAEDWIGLGVFLITALVVSQLAGRWRQEARESSRLAEEQAALRRVATLVARTSPSEVFDAVTREVGLLSGADLARMERYETDGTVTGVAGWSKDVEQLAVGTRIPLEGVSIAALVLETTGPVRVDSFADAFGEIAQEARDVGIRSSVGCPIVVGGRLWGVIAASSKRDAPFPSDTESQMAEFTELVSTAIANAESRAELRASRARIVAAADETRRRIERDLHDGTQQRLVSLGLELRATQARMPPELPELSAQLANATRGLAGALEDLQELSRGIHPAILSRGGLGPAVQTLSRRSAVPVVLDLRLDRRLPDQVEVGAYYVVSEALANTAKHAQASVVHVELEADDGTVKLSIHDDGIGGADPSRGSGLVGVRDRIDALGGTIDIASSSGKGTNLVVWIPIRET
jgi:signal transduction histidine kinase